MALKDEKALYFFQKESICGEQGTNTRWSWQIILLLIVSRYDQEQDKRQDHDVGSRFSL